MLKNCVTKNYLKLFQRHPKFGGTSICLIYSLVKSFNKYYYFKITSRLWSHTPDKKNVSDKNHFKEFEKKKDASLCFWSCFWFSHALFHFAMFLLTYSAPRTRFLSSTTHSPRFGAKSEIYYSSVAIHYYYSLSLFTCYYSLRNFAYLRGVVPYISSRFWVCLVQDFFPRESYPLWAFLWEISLLTTTSLHLYYLYKACN